jgi:hypothetical protein
LPFLRAGEKNESFLSNRQVELDFMVDREVGGNPGGDATMNVRVR